MKISINWIKEFVDLNGIEPEELVKRFNLSTAEIEGVEYKGKDTFKVVFGKILEVKNHPESQKLHILKVDEFSRRAVVEKSVVVVHDAQNEKAKFGEINSFFFAWFLI